MKLARNDIEYIRFDLRRRGVGEPGLFEELVDHVCCEVEPLLRQGVPFKKAYEKVLREIAPAEFVALQSETIRSRNYNTPLMLQNTWKIMLRNLRKHGTHAIINVAGLALGLACFVAITLYVKHELAYDRSFAKASSIYRVTMSST